MSDVAEFLKARLDEDEAIALAAIEDDGDDSGLEGMFVNLTTPGATHWLRGNALSDEFAAMLVRYVVPARVLREVEVKRRLLAMFPDPADGDGWNEAGAQVLEVLATAYSDHPDFRDEWRP